MGMKQGREYRAVQDFSIVPRAEEKDEYRVRGTAVVFDTPTVLFEYDGVKYSEVIDRNAFDECDMSDVIFNYNHGGKVVARLRNKTLALTIDERGLHMEADLGGTQAGRELYEEIDGGYVDKMSFSFSVRESKYDSVTHTRTITKVKKLSAISRASSIPKQRQSSATTAPQQRVRLSRSARPTRRLRSSAAIPAHGALRRNSQVTARKRIVLRGAIRNSANRQRVAVKQSAERARGSIPPPALALWR